MPLISPVERDRKVLETIPSMEGGGANHIQYYLAVTLRKSRGKVLAISHILPCCYFCAPLKPQKPFSEPCFFGTSVSGAKCYQRIVTVGLKNKHQYKSVCQNTAYNGDFADFLAATNEVKKNICNLRYNLKISDYVLYFVPVYCK